MVLATSARVAPGLLTARAWDTLRAARRVLTGLPGHPQLAALAEAGIDCQVVPGLDPQSVARLLHEEAAAAAGSIVWLPGPDGWLAAPGGEEATGPLLAALAALGEPGAARRSSCCRVPATCRAPGCSTWWPPWTRSG